jgi:hypothetical protein
VLCVGRGQTLCAWAHDRKTKTEATAAPIRMGNNS